MHRGQEEEQRRSLRAFPLARRGIGCRRTRRPYHLAFGTGSCRQWMELRRVESEHTRSCDAPKATPTGAWSSARESSGFGGVFCPANDSGGFTHNQQKCNRCNWLRAVAVKRLQTITEDASIMAEFCRAELALCDLILSRSYGSSCLRLDH